ncbi:phage/plasmid primase, P4 family [uncultured Desulfosarcina sp.]|uniref:DNA primase family protein n=1 Tax=uncultured Desulfosarcina sp. TaxID=218289 RepID=UPI0029C6BE92|nr:phage/plasmid primase, P4 family [uncultured Desulfosarcina sp.]
MYPQNMITDKQRYQKAATLFFNILFAESLRNGCGEIQIDGFYNGPKYRSYHNNIQDAVNAAYQACQQGLEVYFGINPRVGQASGEKNIHYLSSFHAEVDYGQAGHKKKPEYDTYDDALAAIIAFEIPPTIVIHSGGGFHCYWVLNTPANVSEIGLNNLENVNRAILVKIHADVGTHNINRILRVPGTFNFKLPGNHRPVDIVMDSGPTYELNTFRPFMDFQSKPKSKKTSASTDPVIGSSEWDQDISSLPVSPKIKSLIINGNDGSYPSRSEADQAVITVLFNKGMDFAQIKGIFENYRIGDKYREHSSPDDYLKHNIEKAKEFSNLAEEERQDPLFISGAIHKSDNGKYSLKIVSFQEFMYKKHMLKFLEKEQACFRYNGKCYEQVSDYRLNNICQMELGPYRELFTPSMKTNFIHYAIGNDLVDTEKAYKDQVRYLTMQNGLYDLSTYELIGHDSKIFTTNLLPYDYDPEAECPRWLQYLDEVFMGDADTILFIQEAVGYAFHKAIPKAVIFFLVGDGGNGKSVFIDVISGLCGKENVCNISLNRLNDERYLPELFGKMINVSGETPNARCMNTDLIKAVVAGDWVTGRELYKRPTSFQPFTKHFLGMNILPEIEDNTHGMWRRIHVVDFPRKFSENEMDVELTNKLILELSGIFNWALEGYKRLRDQSFIFSESPSMRRSKSRYRQNNSSVIDFAESKFTKIFGGIDSVPFKDVYSCYQDFCSTEGLKRTLSKKEFRAGLESEGYRIENSSKHSNQLRIFSE